MRAVVFDRYGGPAEVRDVPDPRPAPHGVVVRVEATGLCRSDWHGWAGHDPDITLPHVPGHELAGVDRNSDGHDGMSCSKHATSSGGRTMTP
ncbi:alcohol dehydrogenase catalytic domain-containing protein, partial [Streptomyces sp. NPDC048279]|uniref:alcohol dehydrogenase catalytic domain-containing protein n=1 Tax=Streptomyces sp. NPDC048279 TaxID=3154714 RepID=UPI00342BE20F